MVFAIGEIKSSKRGTRVGKGRKLAAETVNAVGNVDNSDFSDSILNSGSSRHLVNDVTLIQGIVICGHEVYMADGESLKLTKHGSVRLAVIANGEEKTIKLPDVYLASQLTRHIISYGILEEKGFGLVYNGSSRALVRRSDNAITFDVSMHTNVLYVQKSVTEARQE
ncbi:unnamed protein product [Peronospora belbahrii]|uniref:Retrovirus-related Pol polyprotein from transposon TNT 1-94-like beta-barrel domain-containing protein n=1 Tax=Peronospora belbahrii TaxID=622444 RepID=A0ABN8D2K7_9STRA|nr:unnamed protein product [Peronospora belbahrii]